MINTDFNDIVLLKNELKALKKLNKSNWLAFNCDITLALRTYKLIYLHSVGCDETGDPIYDGSCCISDFGKRYLCHLKNGKRAKTYEWLRYIITTIIAIAALVISITKS